MAPLLDRFGIDCIVADREPTTTEHPKSRGCLARTMELFRQWAIEEAIRARGKMVSSSPSALVCEIATFTRSTNSRPYGEVYATANRSREWPAHYPPVSLVKRRGYADIRDSPEDLGSFEAACPWGVLWRGVAPSSAGRRRDRALYHSPVATANPRGVKMADRHVEGRSSASCLNFRRVHSSLRACRATRASSFSNHSRRTPARWWSSTSPVDPASS